MHTQAVHKPVAVVIIVHNGPALVASQGNVVQTSLILNAQGASNDVTLVQEIARLTINIQYLRADPNRQYRNLLLASARWTPALPHLSWSSLFFPKDRSVRSAGQPGCRCS